MRRFLIVTVVLWAILIPLTASSQPADVSLGAAEIVKAVYDAVAANDVDGAMTLFAEDAVLTIVPGGRGTDGVFVGKDAIRGWYEGLASLNGRAEFSGVEVSGNSAAWTLSWWDSSLEARGIAPYVTDGASVAQNGQIKTLSLVLTPETLAKRAAYKLREANEKLAHRYLEEMWDEGNMETAEEIIADDFVDHYPRPGNDADKAALMANAAGFHERGMTNQIDDLIVAEDTIVIRVTVTDPIDDEEMKAVIFLGVKDGQITERRIALFGWE